MQRLSLKHWSTKTVIFSAESWPCFQIELAAGGLKLYSFLAEHIDPTCGAVVADQQFLAEKLGVSRSTIIRWLN
ncbi:helix-turn-helix domain-containing protein, partial [Haemophilus influenzae]|uniref:helix-turn-helix domain-containing protein n=1 Tax=Haemophilus influenzae TaxID=727 RepID=UPI001E4E1005